MYLAIPGRAHEKYEAAYQNPNTVAICIFQKNDQGNAEITYIIIFFFQG